jgi:hypothetical protein
MGEPAGNERRARTGRAAAVAVGGLVVVAVASGDAVGRAGGDLPDATTGLTYVRNAHLVLGVVVGGVVGVTLIIELLRDPAPKTESNRSWWVGMVVAAVVLAVLLLLPRPEPDERGADEPAASSPPIESAPEPSAPPEGGPFLPLAAGLAALVVVAAVVALRRRPAPETEAAETASADVAAALAAGVADLRDDPDPRRAILRTWERLEQVFGLHGLGREPQETTAELARRALGALDASAASSSRLADLVELAMYSVEPLTRGDQLVAIDAFESVRSEIEHGGPEAAVDNDGDDPASVPGTRNGDGDDPDRRASV